MASVSTYAHGAKPCPTGPGAFAWPRPRPRPSPALSCQVLSCPVVPLSSTGLPCPASCSPSFLTLLFGIATPYCAPYSCQIIFPGIPIRLLLLPLPLLSLVLRQTPMGPFTPERDLTGPLDKCYYSVLSWAILLCHGRLLLTQYMQFLVRGIVQSSLSHLALTSLLPPSPSVPTHPHPLFPDSASLYNLVAILSPLLSALSV